MEAKRIVITGVSRGLGRAMTARFIEQGHTVWGCARSAAAIAELQQRWPAPHSFHAVDVVDDRQVGRWADAVLAGGPIDLLVNNAALINRNAVLWEVPAEEFDRLVDVNIKGVANVIRHFVPAMVARKRGVIVNFSSGWGRSVSPEEAPYCATKWAIEGLTLALARELPRGMAAVPLNPGIIDTDMLRISFGGDASSYPSPDEWATRAVPFLLQLGPKGNGLQLSVPE
ncbi:MAG TPA: SDR family oxidoreductase [Pirellulales bacterium]|jgi:NAD(P)-dependent dehydrogenase (short-subunit alcohol dehydrogenase family)|nr:SDR family oxidoreductase [Pirellulales bacterium]